VLSATKWCGSLLQVFIIAVSWAGRPEGLVDKGRILICYLVRMGVVGGS
jgi:hypothetical protein